MLSKIHNEQLLNYEPRTIIDLVHNREREIVKQHLDALKYHDKLANAAVRTTTTTKTTTTSEEEEEAATAAFEGEEGEQFVTETIVYEHENSAHHLNYKNLQQIYKRRELAETRSIHGTLPQPGHALYQQSVIEQKVARMNEPFLPFRKQDIPEYEAAELMGTFWSQTESDAAAAAAEDEAKTFGDRFTDSDISEALELYADHVLRKKVLDPHKSIKYTKMVQVFTNQILNNRALIEQYDEAFLSTVDTHGQDITLVQRELREKFSQIYVRSMLAMGAVSSNNNKDDIIRMEEERLVRTRERNRELVQLCRRVKTEELTERFLRERKIARYLQSLIEEKRPSKSPLTQIADRLMEETEKQIAAESDAGRSANATPAESAASSGAKRDIARYESLINGLANRGTMYDVSPQELLQTAYFKSNHLQSLFDRFVLGIDAHGAIEATALQKFESYQDLYESRHAFKEDLDKLDRVGRFVDDVLHLKSLNNQLENMIVRLVPMMYQSRVLIHDLVTCNKLLYICKTSGASDLTRVGHEVFAATLGGHDEAVARQTLMEQAMSIVDQSEREYNVIHHPFEVSKEPFYTSSAYIPYTKRSVRAKQRQVRRF